MNIQKHIKETIITILVISITAGAYASLTTVTSGDTLTATKWNDMVNLVNSNEAKLTDITYTGGNLGIGDITPSYKLDVRSTTNTISQFYYNDGSVYPRLQIQGISDGIDIDSTYNTNGGTISFSKAGVEKMRIDKSGNVGIGTIAPTSKLHVNGGNVPIRIERDGITARDILVNSDRFYFRGVDTSKDVLILNENGYVGIANTNPNQALDVTGNIEYTGTITDVSDERLKENVKDINSSLKKIEKVRPVSFEMKDDENDTLEFGVLAQELEKIYPELVVTAKDEMGTKSVNYVGLIAPMIDAIKELKKQNDELKQQNEEIIQEIELLKNK